MKIQITESKLLYGDLLCYYLEAVGVKYAFGIPGGAIESLYNALARSQRRGGLKHVLVRNEMQAGFAAQGYYSQTGMLAVALGTSGPGATNMITGIAAAYNKEIPLIAITAQARLEVFGKDVMQETSDVNISSVGMFEFCTRYNSLISHVDQIETKILAAITAAYNKPQGPVHLSIPRNLLDIPLSEKALKTLTTNVDKINFKPIASEKNFMEIDALNPLLKMIREKKKMVLMVGVNCSRATKEILELANLLNLHVITTPTGKDNFPSNHPNYYGAIGFAGHSSAKHLLENPDLEYIILVGETLNEINSGGMSPHLFKNKIIHIDDCEQHFGTTPDAAMHIWGSIPLVLERLNHSIKNEGIELHKKQTQALPSISPHIHLDNKEAFYNESKSSPYLPQRLMYDLVALLPSNTFYMADAGNSFLWVIHYLFPKQENSLYIPLNWSAMGSPLGYAIGFKIANRDRPAVVITGDGACLMCGGEISAAVQEKLPIIFIILNDHSLGMIHHGQMLAKAEQIGTDLSTVNFSLLGEAMGAIGKIIKSVKDLEQIDFEKILKGDRPLVLDIHVDPDQVPPIAARVQALNIG